MTNIFNKIFYKAFCSHSWTVLSKVHVDSDIGNCYTVIVLTCPKCGAIKKVKV